MELDDKDEFVDSRWDNVICMSTPNWTKIDAEKEAALLDKKTQYKWVVRQVNDSWHCVREDRITWLTSQSSLE